MPYRLLELVETVGDSQAGIRIDELEEVKFWMRNHERQPDASFWRCLVMVTDTEHAGKSVAAQL